MNRFPMILATVLMGATWSATLGCRSVGFPRSIPSGIAAPKPTAADAGDHGLAWESHRYSLSDGFRKFFANSEAVVTPEAELMLDGLAQDSARRLTTGSQADLDAALQNMTRLGQEILQHGEEVGGNRVVTAQSVVDALSKLCPLYPFC